MLDISLALAFLLFVNGSLAASPVGTFAGNAEITFSPASAWSDSTNPRTLADGSHPVTAITSTAGATASFTIPGGNVNFTLFGETATNQGLHKITIDGVESPLDFFQPLPDPDAVIDVKRIFSQNLCGAADQYVTALGLTQPASRERHSTVVITDGGEDARATAVGEATFLVLYAYVSTPVPFSPTCAAVTTSSSSTSATLSSASSSALAPVPVPPAPAPTPNIVVATPTASSKANTGQTSAAQGIPSTPAGNAAQHRSVASAGLTVLVLALLSVSLG